MFNQIFKFFMLTINRHFLLSKGIFFISLIFSTLQAWSQATNPIYNDYQQYLSGESTNSTMIFQDGSQVYSWQLINTLNQKLATLGSAYSYLQLEKDYVDADNIRHITYTQAINGISVENSMVKIHESNGLVTSATVHLHPVTVTNYSPTFSSSQARTYAENSVSSGTVYYPAEPKMQVKTPELSIIYENGTYDVVWKLDLYTENPSSHSEFCIQAQSGALIRETSALISCGSSQVTTRLNGQQTIKTQSLDANNDFLMNTCESTCGMSNLDTTYTLFYQNWNLYDIINPSGQAWGTSLDHQIAYQIHWGLSETQKYFNCEHDRAGYDDDHAIAIGVMNAGQFMNTDDNAQWDQINQMMFFGDGGDGSGTFFTTAPVSVDILGHEFTHAVTNLAANLQYRGESGALNEAWSDIFGTDIEFFAQNGTGNYDIGEACFTSGSLRSMSNPNSQGQPDTYNGTYYIPTGNCTPSRNNDYCGVHTNSGVANYWFYLLSEGGSGTNDLGNSFSVTGISRNKAIQIAYKALTTYFTSNTNFEEARLLTTQAAKDIFGECSQEAFQVANAWYAVGVGGTAAYASSCSPLSETGLYFTGLPLTGNNWPSQFVEVPNASKFNIGTGNFTLEMIIRPDEEVYGYNHGEEEVLFLTKHRDWYAYNGGFKVVLNTSWDHPTYGHDEGIHVETRTPGYSSIGGLVSLQDGNCHHIGIVRNNGVLSIYVDGVLLDSGPCTDTFIDPSQLISIGGHSLSFLPQRSLVAYKGVMKEVRIWNIARSEAEINSTKDMALSGSENGLLAYYPFNEGSGQIVYDLAANPRNGRLGDYTSAENVDPEWKTTTCSGPVSRVANHSNTYTMHTTASKVKVFPNPFNDKLTYSAQFNSELTYSAKLVNLFGQELYHRSNLVSGQEYIIGKDLEPGQYILVLKSGDEVKHISVVKE